ncbi:MAG: ribosome maturation factor RimP [Gammaproteobacteria bacterium]|nr:ribosome maturation factor RimP [Gammaproteobacteria bacterium]NIR82309.1 ribosome maturation factor RimP [Gammaproteobacteria bacterium]NIU03458.1 ribosome maturation factor RimP [Gammaproteobacteria bacterium]NIX84733.1 ribosome maturation factor RimP [Gammaproteobacteria bacterium]
MRQAPEWLRAIVEPVVTAMGYEPVGVEYRAQGRGGLVRVYIDRTDGVTVEDCERVSHQLSGVLDVEDPIPGSYTLEVSSPGLDRPLFKTADFERYAGHEVQIRLAEPLGGRRRFKGRLKGLRGEEALIEQDGQEVCLPLADIEEARLVPEL